ncbi:MAG: D-alanyl-D-alanine carboxypeptidase/D-alanyl-D-alanine-endopeptidase [Phycisphaerales bacterium]|nr:D-alanyl-D-alanine carboxypeptidase/D-alanyl-D-alanine-endopeptidase [Phycisphaerales bacterium]
MSRFHPRAPHFVAMTSTALLVLATIWWTSGDPKAAAEPATTTSTTSTTPIASRLASATRRPSVPVAPPRSSPAEEKKLASEVRRLVADARDGKGSLKDTDIAVSIRACDDGPGPGREIIAINGDRPLLPASNMKLIATGAALDILGADFAFETRVRATDDTFVVIGDGDPSLADPSFFSSLTYRDAEGEQQELDEEAILGFWADAIAEAAPPDGRVTILVDDSIFERRLWNDGTNGRDGWNPEDRLRGFSAEVAGLNFHRNTIHFRPRTSGTTRPSWSDMRPRLDSMLQSAKNDSTISSKEQTAWILRSPESDQLTFKGKVRPPKKGRPVAPLEVTVHDPAMQFLKVLADRVRSRGITVERIGRTTNGRAQAGRDVGPVVRMPIAPIVEHCNEASQNLYAESLLKRSVHESTGRPGSWTDADRTIERIAAERLGAAAPSLTSNIRIEDGSGLSRRNLVTTRFLTAWLDSFHDDPELSEVFVESLARGGEEGTLKSRFTELRETSTHVDAKTGFMTGVSCLSGFVTAEDGRRWSFSIFCNGFRGTSIPAKRLQEAIVMAIADHIE